MYPPEKPFSSASENLACSEETLASLDVTFDDKSVIPSVSYVSSSLTPEKCNSSFVTSVLIYTTRAIHGIFPSPSVVPLASGTFLPFIFFPFSTCLSLSSGNAVLSTD